LTRNPTNASPDTTGTRELEIAVIQPAARRCEEHWDLRRVEGLVRDAVREHHRDIVVLPVARNTPNVCHADRRRLPVPVPVPVDGAPCRLLKPMARELGCCVSGGDVSLRGAQPRHRYMVAEPVGTTYLHDTDDPSVWEYCSRFPSVAA
jgi:predicted amidohydrolase